MFENKEKFNPIYTALPNVRFALRLIEKLQNEIVQYSKKCNISMNTLILECIEYALKNEKSI